MTHEPIPFNRPYLTGTENRYLTEALASGKLAGDGPFTARCRQALAPMCGSRDALLTHSGTAALEMCALLLDLQPGDEVIMPSFTFVSTANAFVLRGAVPVFVDCSPQTLNIDPAAIEAAIGERTRAIVVVHYAGVGCDMEAIGAIAARHGLAVVEDAAQAIMASRNGRALGSFGDFGAVSFHDTKNITCGEGGALLINRADSISRAEILREKGTDRSRFLRGQVDKYTWQDVGSSFLMSDVLAAFLCAQLEAAQDITARRLELWQRYHALLAPLESQGWLRRQVVPAECRHNGHIYFVLLDAALDRDRVLQAMREQGVTATFHYVPLHSAPAGRRLGRAVGELATTDSSARCLIRLPMWIGLDEARQARVVEALAQSIRWL